MGWNYPNEKSKDTIVAQKGFDVMLRMKCIAKVWPDVDLGESDGFQGRLTTQQHTLSVI